MQIYVNVLNVRYWQKLLTGEERKQVRRAKREVKVRVKMKGRIARNRCGLFRLNRL